MRHDVLISTFILVSRLVFAFTNTLMLTFLRILKCSMLSWKYIYLPCVVNCQSFYYGSITSLHLSPFSSYRHSSCILPSWYIHSSWLFLHSSSSSPDLILPWHHSLSSCHDFNLSFLLRLSWLTQSWDTICLFPHFWWFGKFGILFHIYFNAHIPSSLEE